MQSISQLWHFVKWSLSQNLKVNCTVVLIASHLTIWYVETKKGLRKLDQEVDNWQDWRSLYGAHSWTFVISPHRQSLSIQPLQMSPPHFTCHLNEVRGDQHLFLNGPAIPSIGRGLGPLTCEPFATDSGFIDESKWYVAVMVRLQKWFMQGYKVTNHIGRLDGIF